MIFITYVYVIAGAAFITGFSFGVVVALLMLKAKP